MTVTRMVMKARLVVASEPRLRTCTRFFSFQSLKLFERFLFLQAAAPNPTTNEPPSLKRKSGDPWKMTMKAVPTNVLKRTQNK